VHVILKTKCLTGLTLSSSTPRKQALRRQLRRERETSGEEEDGDVAKFCLLCDKLLPQNLAGIVKMQVINKNAPTFRRYSREYKQFAITLFFLSPMAYRFLRTTFLLPTVRTLQRMTEKIQINPGLSRVVFDILKIKSKSLGDEGKDCVLCADEMNIKGHLFYDIGADEIVGFQQLGASKDYLPANNVLAIMARGIFENWKQPLAYVFLNTSCNVEQLKILLFEVIDNLRSLGFRVRGFISDVGSNFVSLSKLLNVTIDAPFFYTDVLEQTMKIYYFFDICHLLKALRNNFLKYLFILECGQIIDANYLHQFFERDQGRNLRLAPKLTRVHLHPGAFDKMKVKLAAQLFSNQVATGMETELSTNLLPASAFPTIDFISNINSLFDILNSTGNIDTDERNYKNIFKGADYQIQHLQKMLNLFATVKVEDRSGKDVTQRIKSLHCWQLTIKNMTSLHQDVNEPLITRRLNQDFVENFFGTVRKQSGNCYNPTPIQFKRAFKKLFCMKYVFTTQPTREL
jgi:hypothetical protein